MLAANILLALVWCALWGRYSPAMFAAGFVLGYLLLAVLARRGVVSATGYVRKAPKVLALAGSFFLELLASNLRLARELVTPGLSIRPRLVAVPIEAQSDLEIFLLASLITLTPGTMSVEASPDRSVLYIHTLYGGDSPDELRRSIREGFERRVLEVTR